MNTFNNGLGLVHVADMGGDTRAYPINGGNLTARMILADFFGVDGDAVESLGRTFKLVNRGEISGAALDRPLAHGDVITVYSHAIAKGGVPGGAF